MKALSQLALCALVAAFLTVIAIAAMACTPIGFVGLPLTALIFGAVLVVVAHWYGVEWGR